MFWVNLLANFFQASQSSICPMSLKLFVPPPSLGQWHPPSLSVTWPWEAAAGSTMTLWWLCNYILLHTHVHNLKCLLLLRTEKNSCVSQRYMCPTGYCPLTIAHFIAYKQQCCYFFCRFKHGSRWVFQVKIERSLRLEMLVSLTFALSCQTAFNQYLTGYFYTISLPSKPPDIVCYNINTCNMTLSYSCCGPGCFCCSFLVRIKLTIHCFELLVSCKAVNELGWEVKPDTAVINAAVVWAFSRWNGLNCVCVWECAWSHKRLFTCLCINNSVFSCDSFVTFHHWIPGLLTVAGAQCTRFTTLLLLFPSDHQDKPDCCIFQPRISVKNRARSA